MTEAIGITLSSLGAILVAITLIVTHNRLFKRDKITESEISEMKSERVVAIAGLLLLFVGYIFQILDKF